MLLNSLQLSTETKAKTKAKKNLGSMPVADRDKTGRAKITILSSER
jgi:hypothetical protein